MHTENPVQTNRVFFILFREERKGVRKEIAYSKGRSLPISLPDA